MWGRRDDMRTLGEPRGARVSPWVAVPAPMGAARRGELAVLGGRQKPLTEGEKELRRLRRELAEVTMERDVLKKAAAYFAKASRPGTR